ncbi:MAG: isoprenyl transferase [Gammaproteobacteria bacterium]|nr:isoprenyl transferase [Gammaproteobacteria bacterium]
MTGDTDHSVIASPRHVAIIMDGNGRWAKRKGLPRNAGHKYGVDAVKHVMQACGKHQVEYLTLFAFSSENWRRPITEVTLLMELFLVTLSRELKGLQENNVCIRFIGDCAAFDAKLQKQMQDASLSTQNNTGLKLNIAVNYGGRWDITQAVQTVIKQVQAGKLSIDEISEQTLASYMSLADQPEPDLLIRTSGESRTSNFLIWQCAYTEIYFTDTLWPDFDEAAFSTALQWYAQRERRFGKTSEQLQPEQVKHA